MRNGCFLITIALSLSFACATEAPTPDQEPARGKADLPGRICEEAGAPPDCDVCELKDWYGDGVCDDFCDQPDPDCDAAFCVEGTVWECDDAGESWTGQVCCVDGPVQCVQGSVWECDDAGESWTGTVCCVNATAKCVEGTVWECDDAGESWTGTICCVDDTAACVPGSVWECDDAGESWTGKVCCLDG